MVAKAADRAKAQTRTASIGVLIHSMPLSGVSLVAVVKLSGLCIALPFSPRSTAALLRFNILLPSPFRSQPHTWPPAISELYTSGFQYSAYGCHCLGIARIPTGLDLGDSVAVEASFFRQLLNSPMKQATRGPNLRRCHNCWKRLYILCAELYDGSMSAAPSSREFEC